PEHVPGALVARLEAQGALELRARGERIAGLQQLGAGRGGPVEFLAFREIAVVGLEDAPLVLRALGWGTRRDGAGAFHQRCVSPDGSDAAGLGSAADASFLLLRAASRLSCW